MPTRPDPPENASLLVRCGKQPAVVSLSQALGPPDPRNATGHTPGTVAAGGNRELVQTALQPREQKKADRTFKNDQTTTDGRQVETCEDGWTTNRQRQPACRACLGRLKVPQRQNFRLRTAQTRAPGKLALVSSFAGCLPLFRSPSRSAKSESSAVEYEAWGHICAQVGCDILFTFKGNMCTNSTWAFWHGAQQDQHAQRARDGCRSLDPAKSKCFLRSLPELSPGATSWNGAKPAATASLAGRPLRFAASNGTALRSHYSVRWSARLRNPAREKVVPWSSTTEQQPESYFWTVDRNLDNSR